jgi:hypothetical protein
MHPELDDDGTVIDECPFEVHNLLNGALHGGTVNEALDAFDEYAAIPTAVKDRHLTFARQGGLKAP